MESQVPSLDHVPSRAIAWRLARRLMRSRIVRTLGLLSFATSLVALTVFTSLGALSLSPDQARERDFGDYDVSASIGVRETQETSKSLDRAASYFDLHNLDWATTLLAQLQPSDVGVRPLSYLEGPWADSAWRGSYRLLRGAFASGPGDVAVTPALEGRYPIGSQITVASGHGVLRVVGVVDDTYQRDAGIVLAAPGTWETFDWSGISQRGVSMSASQVIYWRDDDPIATIDRLSRLGVGLETPTTPRTEVRGWLDRLPLAYQLPSVFFALGMAFAAFGLARRHQRRRAQVLAAIGVPERAASMATSIAVGTQTMIGGLLGTLVGSLVGLSCRPLLNRLADQPLSPYEFPWEAIAQWLILTAIGSVIGSLLLRPAESRPAPRRVRRFFSSWIAASVRRVALLGLACFMLAYGVNASNLIDVMFLVGPASVAAILLVPELMGLVSKLEIPDTWAPGRRLVGRHIAADTWRPGLIVAMIILAVGPGLILPVFASSIEKSENDRQVPTAAPGQLLVTGPNGATDKPPQAAVLDRLRESAPDDSRMTALYIVSGDDRAASFDPGSGVAAAVESVGDASALSNGALSDEQERVLSSGGVLTWGDFESNPLYVRDGSRRTVEPVDVKVLGAPFQPSWQQRYTGLMLTTTAHELGLPTTLTAQVFTGLSAGEGQRMKQSVYSDGLDVSSVYFSRPPVPFELPLGFQIAAVGVLVLLVAVVCSLLAVQVRSLRSYGNALLAIGLSHRWIGRVIAGEALVLVGTGLVFAVAAVVAPIVLLSQRVPDFVVTVPWGVLLSVLFGWGLLSVATLVHMNRKVSTGSGATE